MPPRKKRKASEEAADAPETTKSSKKTKKELLAEARARAKQWADEETAKKKASAPQNLPKTNTDANAADAASAAAASNWPKKSPAKASPATHKTAISPAASTKKSSVEQKVAEARARAKAWAAGEEVEKMTVASKQQPTEYKSPPRSHARKPAPAVHRVDDQVMEDFHDAEDGETAKIAEVLPPAASTRIQPNPVQKPIISDDKPRQKARDQFNPELERVQAQVIANAAAYEAALARQASMNHPNPEVQQEWHEQSSESKRTHRYLRGLLLIVLVVTGVAFIVFGVLPGLIKLLPSTSFLTDFTTHAAPSRQLPPCFSPHGISDTEELPEAPTYFCDKSLPRIPCPDQGNCRGGQLHYCRGRYLQVASDGSKCVLDEASNLTIAKVEAIVANWTIQHFCSFDGVEFAHKSKNKAGCIFPLTKVTDEVDVDKLLLWRSKIFEIELVDDDVFIGLSDDYVDTKLSIPTTCWVGLFAVETLSTLASTTFYTTVQVISALCSVTFAYPLASLICLVILLVIIWTRHLRESRKKLIVDVANVREVAYERLRSDSLEHVVLHLRDGIAMDLYPTSKADRSHVILKVWPRVVADVRLDNRVLKTNRMVGGKPRDVWKWVAPPSSKKKAKMT
ncbi:hypothetical protein MHU86_11902 [Fragilaria crotonensis]|nr:hypothetical protein MHU86_11902 [Fragilaria crotonensis]